MKQLFTFLLVAISSILLAQAPQSIPYQAIVRNTDGSVMASTSITMTFKIHDVSATGTVVYEETHSTSSNTQGLVSLNVGAGTAVTGTFTDINWGSGAKYLHVLMNTSSGNVELGTQQIMSVPYALYSEDVNIRVSVSGDSLFIGDQFSIVPGVSAANPISMSNYGSVLLPYYGGICENVIISVTGCGGQDSLLYQNKYYSLVEIAGQCWFAENLNTAYFSNGDSIPQLSDLEYDYQGGLQSPAWTSPVYTKYPESFNISEEFGGLYNFPAVLDERNICPTGWHVPSNCEWLYMEYSLGFADTSYYNLNNLSSENTYDFYYTNILNSSSSIYSLLVKGDPLSLPSQTGLNLMMGGERDICWFAETPNLVFAQCGATFSDFIGFTNFGFVGVYWAPPGGTIWANARRIEYWGSQGTYIGFFEEPGRGRSIRCIKD